MAIGFLNARRRLQLAGLAALALASLQLHSLADDQVTKKDGTVITGQVAGVAGGQVAVISRASNGSTVKLSYSLADIQSVTMAPPDAVTKVRGAAPAEVIAALEPVIKQYAGLPTDWVVDAMAQLADAYNTAGQPERATAAYDQINQLYPNSAYQIQAVAGKARQSLKLGKIDEALAALQPIVDQANKNLAPSPAEGRLYANAFLVYGQALEAQKKPSQALEAYLTVKTMFYQNSALVEQAEQLTKNLRDQNPGLGID